MKSFMRFFKKTAREVSFKLNGYAIKACSASVFAVIRVTLVLGNGWAYLGF